ncbi:hypothetical protein [Phytohabitans suffuscus]|uniref:Uncharacterized protein n=1 Tax=Phytohabitans suffuscus TaxID=624315 RepID=A0A6F8YWY9_9ACTN|nr:hypothetical protein [Phytohabitans suffuscus]BCB90371.1 hypothetical protein Psuf_076840 [Phytohabitans suffuscus]
MTEFDVPTEAHHDLPAQLRRDGGPVDRLSYDLDGGEHFDLVREEDRLDAGVEDAFGYKP